MLPEVEEIYRRDINETVVNAGSFNYTGTYNSTSNINIEDNSDGNSNSTGGVANLSGPVLLTGPGVEGSGNHRRDINSNVNVNVSNGGDAGAADDTNASYSNGNYFINGVSVPKPLVGFQPAAIQIACEQYLAEEPEDETGSDSGSASSFNSTESSGSTSTDASTAVVYTPAGSSQTTGWVTKT